jgi:hypothetical protein
MLNKEDSLHLSAFSYYKYFLENQFTLKISTITIAEYCVRGRVSDLPFKDLRIVPFNYNHAVRTGEFANVLFIKNKKIEDKLKPRFIIPNDSKLFAQADVDEFTQYFVTSDTSSLKAHSMLKTELNPNFEIIDIHLPCNEFFMRLDL